MGSNLQRHVTFASESTYDFLKLLYLKNQIGGLSMKKVKDPSTPDPHFHRATISYWSLSEEAPPLIPSSPFTPLRYLKLLKAFGFPTGFKN